LEHADLSLELLQVADEVDALRMANQLEMINIRRRKKQDEILRVAIGLIEAEFKNDWAFVLGQENWSAGVVGIVAGQIAERYQRPTIMLEKKGDEAKGSGRSIAGFNLIEALNVHREALVKFGGHKQAVGLSMLVAGIEDFRSSLNMYTAKKLRGGDLSPRLNIEVLLSADDLCLETVRHLRDFGPFGAGNPEPIFITKGVRVSGKRLMGRENQHLKFHLQGLGSDVEAISFGAPKAWLQRIESGDKLDIVYRLNVNHFNEQTRLQLRLLDLRRSQ